VSWLAILLFAAGDHPVMSDSARLNSNRAGLVITPALVATVQNAIRWRAPGWSHARAAAVAQALNETPQPALMLAIGVLESDLRPRELLIRVRASNPTRHGPRGTGVPARADWRSSAGTTDHERSTERAGTVKVADVGLCGVACLLGPGGRCTNGPATGLTIAKLRDPATNIRVAAAVLAAHGGDLRRYHGSSNPMDTYEARAMALVAAFSGAVTKVKNKRTRAHVRMIAAAVLAAKT
jgi:hypothetical protein